MEVEEGGLDPLEDWQLVGDAYYSRRLLYDLAWGSGGSGGGAAFDLAFMRCAACCLGCGVCDGAGMLMCNGMAAATAAGNCC